VVCDHEAGAAHALRLVRQQVAALRVGVVGNHKACGRELAAACAGAAADGAAVKVVKHLQQLERLGAGRGAHVQHLQQHSTAQHANTVYKWRSGYRIDRHHSRFLQPPHAKSRQQP
jgi:hypothetical protein